MTDDGARDERLAGLLEVEPLDELTRRRLVSTALRESAPAARHRGRLVAAVAAATLVVAGGLGLLAVNDDGGGVPAANRSETSRAPLDKSAEAAPVPSTAPPSTSAVESSPSSLGDVTAQSAAAVRDAGDFGDLNDPADLRRARSAFAAAVPTEANGADAGAANRSARLVARARAASCASDLSDGTIVAVGTASFGGRDAVVVATARDDGTQVVEALVFDPCAVRPLD